MLMPTVFHENLFDDFFDPFWNDASIERMMNREARDTFGKRGANMMKTMSNRRTTATKWPLICRAARRTMFRWN